MSYEKKNNSQLAEEKNFSLSEEELSLIYNLSYVIRDIAERQKICENEFFRFLDNAYSRIEEEQKKKFIKYFGDRFTK